MTTQKKILLTVAVTVISGSALMTTQVYAQTTPDESRPMSQLVQKLADKFGLNKDEVQAVFDQTHQEMMATRQAKEEERLTQLVTDGKLTEEQKQLIIAKRKELQAEAQSKMESLKDKTPEERRTAMKEHREALEAWAKEHNIELKYLMPAHGPGKGRGMRGGPGFGHFIPEDK
jgi:putative NADH-flavin reductase